MGWGRALLTQRAASEGPRQGRGSRWGREELAHSSRDRRITPTEMLRGQVLAEESVPRQGGGERRYSDDPTRTRCSRKVGNWWGRAREGPGDKGRR